MADVVAGGTVRVVSAKNGRDYMAGSVILSTTAAGEPGNTGTTGGAGNTSGTGTAS